MTPVRIRVAPFKKKIIIFKVKQMAVEKHTKAVKRFGARYGIKVRDRLSKIEAIIRKKHRCPYCHYNTIKRVSNGIFECKKCLAKFTGKAYMPMKQKIIKTTSQEKVMFDDELFTKKEKIKKEKETYNDLPKEINDDLDSNEEEVIKN
jgi:large subunit ribosomal protein L37Ae